jgi:hypothetical protein
MRRKLQSFEIRRRCGFSKLDPRGSIGGLDRLEITCRDADAEKASTRGRRKATPSRHCAGVETIALRHQIAVRERNRTRRPCFRRSDRLLWILLWRWWLGWRESLKIVQPETVLRWRRDGWSAIWRYRSRGRWRGGRPRFLLRSGI